MNPVLVGVGALVLLGAVVVVAPAMDKDRRSTADELFMLTDAAENAFERTGLEKPWPQVRTRYEGDDAIAQATLFEGGDRALYFNRAWYSIGEDAVRGTICHEAVHFRIGELYGDRHIATHGPKFKAMCREICGAEHCTEVLH